MTIEELATQRTRELISLLIDGGLSEVEAAELNDLVQSDGNRLELVANQLVLDSLLIEEIGAESLTALVDLVGESLSADADSAAARPLKSPLPFKGRPNRILKYLGWLLSTTAVVVVAFLIGRAENSAVADAATIVRAAKQIHEEPVERIYVVQVERSAADSAEFLPVQDVRVTTQGDRFYVEMNRGERRWVWGRDADGAMWLTLGSRRAIVVAPDEIGVPLQYISDLYSLNIETLLDNVLKNCRLQYSDGAGSSHVITAIPTRRWQSWMRSATVEVDRETKAVRRLVIERRTPQQGLSTVTFTLVDARTADESKYRAEGHLSEPSRFLTRDTQPDRRREFMSNWFGPHAERWIRTSEETPE